MRKQPATLEEQIAKARVELEKYETEEAARSLSEKIKDHFYEFIDAGLSPIVGVIVILMLLLFLSYPFWK